MITRAKASHPKTRSREFEVNCPPASARQMRPKSNSLCPGNGAYDTILAPILSFLQFLICPHIFSLCSYNVTSSEGMPFVIANIFVFMVKILQFKISQFLMIAIYLHSSPSRWVNSKYEEGAGKY